MSASSRGKKCHILIEATWQSGTWMHLVASEGQIATQSLLSAQRGSLMGCLMGPSNANGILVVTLECPGKVNSLRACRGWIFHLCNFPLKSRHNNELQRDHCGKHGAMLLLTEAPCDTYHNWRLTTQLIDSYNVLYKRVYVCVCCFWFVIFSSANACHSNAPSAPNLLTYSAFWSLTWENTPPSSSLWCTF